MQHTKKQTLNTLLTEKNPSARDASGQAFPPCHRGFSTNPTALGGGSLPPESIIARPALAPLVSGTALPMPGVGPRGCGVAQRGKIG